MSYFVLGIFVGFVISQAIFCYKLMKTWEKHTSEIIELRGEANKYYALYRLNATEQQINNERRD